MESKHYPPKRSGKSSALFSACAVCWPLQPVDSLPLQLELDQASETNAIASAHRLGRPLTRATAAKKCPRAEGAHQRSKSPLRGDPFLVADAGRPTPRR